jgi:hypothetical protein
VGQVAAASRKSPPVFRGRRGILTACFTSLKFFRTSLFGELMKKKNRSQRKRRRAARPEAKGVRAKRRERAQKLIVMRGSAPWLRIMPTGIEDELSTDAGRGLFSLRNGRRQPRDLDLYIPGDDLQSR